MILAGPQKKGHYTSGLTKEALQIYMPSSSSAFVGGVLDKVFDGIGKIISAAFPVVGTILYGVTDVLAYIAGLVQVCLTAFVNGVVKFLPQVAAEVVLADIQNNKIDYIEQAAKDCLYTIYRRLTPTGNPVTDQKQGRDGVISLALSFLIDKLGMMEGQNTRVASRIYAAALNAGALDWQAGAAAGYGMVVGLTSEGVPSGFSIKTLVDVPIPISGGGGIKVFPTPDSVEQYLSKLGPRPAEYTAAWIEQAFKAKSGGKIGGGSDSLGTALPWLAVAAVAYFMNKR